MTGAVWDDMMIEKAGKRGERRQDDEVYERLTARFYTISSHEPQTSGDSGSRLVRGL